MFGNNIFNTKYILLVSTDIKNELGRFIKNIFVNGYDD